jgi:hypothetical protein
MNRTRNLILGLMMTALLGAASVQGQVIRGVSDAQVRGLMQRLETRTDTFRSTMDRQLDNNRRIDGTRTEDSIMELINRFENATDELRNSYNSRRSTSAEATNVLNYGWYIDDFMRRNRLAANAVNQWNLIRGDLNLLARYYGVSWNWNRTSPPFGQNFPTGNFPSGNVNVNDAQMNALLRRLETRTDTFRSAVDRRLDNTRMNGTNTEESMMEYINRFESATDSLRNSYNSRRATATEVTEVLNYGWYIDDFMRRNQTMAARNRLGPNVVNQWNLIRNDLNALAGYYNVAWNWNRTTPPFGRNFPTGNFPTANVNVNEAQMRALLRSLETRTNQFRNVVDRRIDNTGISGTNTEASVMEYVNRFESATNTLRDSFNSRRATAAEVTEVLNYGWYIDDFMRRNQTMAARNRLGPNVVNQWNLIRGDLNSLAGYYNVAWNWNRTSPPFGQNFPGGGMTNDRFTGTYRLNTSLSDNVTAVVNRSITGNTAAAVRQRENLERRLSSPQNLAIEMRGNEVTLATNLYSPVTFVADGRVSSETNARGRTTRTSVTMTGNTLTVTTEGDRANDFWVSFTPMSNNRIQMTRRIYLEGRDQQISVTSVYDRVSNVAQWPNVDSNPGWNNTGTTGPIGAFYVPNGTRLTAVLQNRITSNVSQSGDQFTMEVTSPNQYRGAIITGRITEVESSGRVTGRANLSMDFESIRFGNQTYQFAGIIDSAREADGDSISVSNEGTVRDGSQTTRTVTRAGIGAILGALIGAVVGGGEGAAIGAGVGAGAGAGTVLIQGRDNIDLQPGSEFQITATGPANTNVGQR